MTLNPYNKLANIYDIWIIGDNTNLEVLEFYIKIIAKYNPISIVELGIGTGRIAIEIVKRLNKKMIGVDNSKEMLDICQLHISKNKLLENNIILIEQDILKFNKKSKFIIMPFRTIGHFLSMESKKQLFRQVYNNLKKNGIFIFDHYILDKKWAIKNNQKYIKMYQNSDFTIFDKYDFDFNKKILNCKVIKNSEELVSFDFSWFEPSEIGVIIDEVGFRVINVYGDFDFNPLNSNSSQQIWILQK